MTGFSPEGASNAGILFLLSADFLKLAAASCAIAWPFAYLLSKDWLSGFAYRIDPGAGPFLISGSLTLLVVALTVSAKSLRSASADPVQSLRHE